MFDDDFEAMLEAVCEIVGSDVPKITKPQPKPKPCQRSKPDQLSRTKPKDEHEYVPTESTPSPQKIGLTNDRSRQIFDSMKSTVTKERLSEAQVNTFRNVIRNAAAQHGNIYIDQNEFPHVGILYPKEAAEAMLLSRTQNWPGYDLDTVLEGFMFQFIKNQDDVKTFVKKLSDGIYSVKAMEGVMLRLNLQTIAIPSMERMSVRTQFGTVTQTKIPRRSAFTGDLRKRMKIFLQNQGAFAQQIEVVYRGLERIDRSYTTEQKMLGWMGYIVTRAMAENAKQNNINKSDGNGLLLEEKSAAANIQR